MTNMWKENGYLIGKESVLESSSNNETYGGGGNPCSCLGYTEEELGSCPDFCLGPESSEDYNNIQITISGMEDGVYEKDGTSIGGWFNRRLGEGGDIWTDRRPCDVDNLIKNYEKGFIPFPQHGHPKREEIIPPTKGANDPEWLPWGVGSFIDRWGNVYRYSKDGMSYVNCSLQHIQPCNKFFDKLYYRRTCPQHEDAAAIEEAINELGGVAGHVGSGKFVEGKSSSPYYGYEFHTAPSLIDPNKGQISYSNLGPWYYLPDSGKPYLWDDGADRAPEIHQSRYGTGSCGQLNGTYELSWETEQYWSGPDDSGNHYPRCVWSYTFPEDVGPCGNDGVGDNPWYAQRIPKATQMFFVLSANTGHIDDCVPNTRWRPPDTNESVFLGNSDPTDDSGYSHHSLGDEYHWNPPYCRVWATIYIADYISTQSTDTYHGSSNILCATKEVGRTKNGEGGVEIKALRPNGGTGMIKIDCNNIDLSGLTNCNGVFPDLSGSGKQRNTDRSQYGSNPSWFHLVGTTYDGINPFLGSIRNREDTEGEDAMGVDTHGATSYLRDYCRYGCNRNSMSATVKSIPS